MQLIDIFIELKIRRSTIILYKMEIPESYKYAGIFLSMKCNLSCGFCLNDMSREERNNFKELNGEEWVQALNNIESPDVPITFGGGEPMMHEDFIYILNYLKPSLNIDILTNFSHKQAVDRFIRQVDPKKIQRGAPYPSIRVSYHPEQMDASGLIRNVKRAQDAGFNIGIYSVLYPSPKQLESIVKMQFMCKDEGIDFRVKDFTGEYKGEMYGDYSKYPKAVSGFLKSCKCKTSELLIGPNGDAYKCHRDLYKQEFPIGNITDTHFKIEDKFRECNNYGECHFCDIKLKTSNKQKLGHTSVEIDEEGRRCQVK